MSTVVPPDVLLDSLAAALAGPGYLVLDAVLPDSLLLGLQQACRDEQRSSFRPAGIGRGGLQQLDAKIRSDEICWLDPESTVASTYLAYMEGLRSGLNSRLFMGLFDYECHYARYAPGAAYQTHLDAFTGSRSRVLSTVYYLNDDWHESDGGELMLYARGQERLLERVLPVANRLVVFLSEHFPHEVRPAQRERFSVAGWFRVIGGKSWLRLP